MNCLSMSGRIPIRPAAGENPILPQNFTSDPAPLAAIRLSADERFLYVSTRFADVITVFALDGFRQRPSNRWAAAASIPGISS